MDISVLVINYNIAFLVKKCIESLLNQQGVKFEIIVVDNDSKDESIAVLETFLPQITLIANKVNTGFGKANNQAFKVSRGKYIFMLNPDAACTSNHDLANIVKYMDENGEYGLAGTRISNGNGELLITAYHHYPRQKQTTADFSHLPRGYATLNGASMVMRRNVYEKVNGFDEDFFLYGEEIDLCLRVRKSGYGIGYCESVMVRHVGAASEKTTPMEDIIYRKKTSKLLFYRKHYPMKDVHKIVKRDKMRTGFHLLRLSLIKRFAILNQKQQLQYRRHVIVYKLLNDFLKTSPL